MKLGSSERRREASPLSSSSAVAQASAAPRRSSRAQEPGEREDDGPGAFRVRPRRGRAPGAPRRGPLRTRSRAARRGFQRCLPGKPGERGRPGGGARARPARSVRVEERELVREARRPALAPANSREAGERSRAAARARATSQRGGKRRHEHACRERRDEDPRLRLRQAQLRRIERQERGDHAVEQRVDEDDRADETRAGARTRPAPLTRVTDAPGCRRRAGAAWPRRTR